jgi:small membrane protein
MTQPLIKIVLLAAIALVGLFALRGSTRAMHRVLWRGYVVVILVAAALGVLFPGATTWIAHKLGVGRGADLLLYVLVVTFMLVSVILFRRLAALERKYVVLTRALAIQEARSDGAGGEHEGSTSSEPGNASS